MAAPDLGLIAEIMLLAEGFQAARSLARKFVSLYALCDQLLSKVRLGGFAFLAGPGIASVHAARAARMIDR